MTLVLKEEKDGMEEIAGKRFSMNTGKETKERGKLKMTPNFCPCVIRQMVKL